MADAPPLHPQVRPLAFLLGEWQGEGEGSYPPDVEPFRYRETVHFWHAGKPFLAYQQRTAALDDGRPLHTEMGYWRLTTEGGSSWSWPIPSGSRRSSSAR